MPKRKREVDDSDDLVESSESENETVISKQKKKKNKQTPVQDAISENEETVSQTPKKKMKKKKNQSTEITDEETTQKKDFPSEIEVNVSLSRKKKKKRNKRRSAADKEANSSVEPQETSETKPNLPSTKKKAMMSKGFVLFVGQVPHHIKKNDLEKHFATVGGVKDVRLLIYEDSQRPRGCAYVEFVDNEHRKAALKLNGSTLGRAKIKVEYPYQGGKRYGGAKKNKSNAKNGKSRNE